MKPHWKRNKRAYHRATMAKYRRKQKGRVVILGVPVNWRMYS